jgi:hypothetical protein
MNQAVKLGADVLVRSYQQQILLNLRILELLNQAGNRRLRALLARIVSQPKPEQRRIEARS